MHNHIITCSHLTINLLITSGVGTQATWHIITCMFTSVLLSAFCVVLGHFILGTCFCQWVFYTTLMQQEAYQHRKYICGHNMQTVLLSLSNGSINISLLSSYTKYIFFKFLSQHLLLYIHFAQCGSSQISLKTNVSQLISTADSPYDGWNRI